MPDLNLEIEESAIQIEIEMAGPAGPAADPGDIENGVPEGGTVGQLLKKLSSTDYDADWATLVKGDVGLGNVDNTSDANKPISTATQTALDLKANDNAVVHLTGNETVAGTKTFSSDVLVPDEAYGAGWDGSLEVPTKNALYDKIESIELNDGDVVGPSSSTANAIARFSGTTGKIIQDYTSGAPTISNTGAITIPISTALTIATGGGDTKDAINIGAGGTYLGQSNGNPTVRSAFSSKIYAFQNTSGVTQASIGLDTGAITTTIANSSNAVGLTVTQNDTTNNPKAATFTTTAANTGIDVIHSGSSGRSYQSSNTGEGNNYHLYSGTGGASHKTNLYRGSGAITGSYAFFNVDLSNSSSTVTALRVDNAGTGDSIMADTNNNSRTFYGDKDVTNANNSNPAVQIDHTSVVTDAATYTKTGAALQINSNVTETSGTITDSAQVLDINQTHADATGNVLDVNNDGNGRSINIDHDGNSASAITGLFVNVANAGAGAAYAAIFEAGRVGIGTTAPTVPLEVSGQTIASGGFKTGNKTGTYQFTDANAEMRQDDNPAWYSAKANVVTFKTWNESTNNGAWIFRGSNTSTNAVVIDPNIGSALPGMAIGNVTPTHTLTLPSTSTGIALYNTSDQVTNYERGRLSWASNVLTLNTEAAGSGAARNITVNSAGTLNLIGTSGANTATLTIKRSSLPIFSFTNTTNISSNGDFMNFIPLLSSGNGIQIGLDIAPTVSQSSTGGYTALLINPTESSTGSGAKLLIDAQVGSASQFSVTNAGRVTTTGGVAQRVLTITSSATPTINTNLYDAVTITALATAITSMTTNLTGTPSNFDRLTFRIKDDGTARAITWGASFEAKGVALPTTTVISKVLTVGFIYDSVTSKWGCIASAQEA